MLPLLDYSYICLMGKYSWSDNEQARREQRRPQPKPRTAIARSAKPIPKISAHHAVLLQTYTPLARQYRADNPLCIINSPVCTRYTEGVHHVKGKTGKNEHGEPLLNDVRFFKPACNRCNTYIEDHSQWAKDNGHKMPNY